METDINPIHLHDAKQALVVLARMSPKVLTRLYHEYGEAAMEQESREAQRYLASMADAAWSLAKAAQINEDHPS